MKLPAPVGVSEIIMVIVSLFNLYAFITAASYIGIVNLILCITCLFITGVGIRHNIRRRDTIIQLKKGLGIEDEDI